MHLKILIISLTILMCTNIELQAQQKNSNSKTLVVYFSRRGNNYVNGEIKDLKLGNTEVVANKIKDLTNADIFRIEPVTAYPSDYHECTRVAKEEQNKNARPKFKGIAPKISSYDVIYLGYPNWWGTMPMIMSTFLESQDFSGKIIIPFCTHEGSGLGSSESDIKKLAPKAILKKGLAIKGSNVNNATIVIEKLVKQTM